MAWYCKRCGYRNEDSDQSCQNPDCPTHPDQRTSTRWWKCPCSHYNYENQEYCENCGREQSEAVSHGGD